MEWYLRWIVYNIRLFLAKQHHYLSKATALHANYFWIVTNGSFENSVSQFSLIDLHSLSLISIRINLLKKHSLINYIQIEIVNIVKLISISLENKPLR